MCVVIGDDERENMLFTLIIAMEVVRRSPSTEICLMCVYR